MGALRTPREGFTPVRRRNANLAYMTFGNGGTGELRKGNSLRKSIASEININIWYIAASRSHRP